ncbi:hypothetical protein FW755_10970 [Lonepinella koalarum]|uniref:HNH endonuclease n=1 Tax=Lonepinella koalarum TaxID=53417 RepID=UPI0011E3F500|nr:hypothetical protein [Lonepinella koalarum]TYG33268.1 hypothetical protein FW755_12680 [Lonepinella koalarum]TYG33554.1 hypothetical protein FW755_11565 [Lonepinella koalarum]TYG35561.1 hypothetical protein FW755_10970 [Lonepinella koalarum]
MTAVSLNTQMSNLFNKLVRISALSGNKFKQERQINQKHQRELKSTKTISQLITTQGTHLTCAEKKQRAKAIGQIVERQSQIKLTKQLIKQQNREAVERSTKGRRYDRITRDSADEVFSQCVRLRANCTCEICGMVFSPNNMKNLHCCHWYGRGIQALRYDPNNAVALCRNCHFASDKTTEGRTKFGQMMKKRLGDLGSLALQHKVKEKKPLTLSKQQITAHYAIIARHLRQLRHQGREDFINFSGLDIYQKETL